MTKHIIIAGVPRAGKSTVSQIIAKKFGYQHISMDSIIAGFEKAFPQVGIDTGADVDVKENVQSISAKIAPFLRAMMDSGEYDECDYGMVIDVFQLLPEDYRKHIDPAVCEIYYFITSDVTAEERFELLKQYDTPKDYTYYKPEEENRRGCAEIVEISKYYKEQCEKYQLPYFETAQDREKVLGDCMRRLANKTLAIEIAKLIGISLPWETSDVTYEVLDSVKEEGYTRQLISYESEGDKVSAFLLLPDHLENNPAILINHQHNREHHLGKSEVCGLAGNPLQAFGPELARRGFVVLAPDSICFEERRKDPTVEGFDFGQHFDEMCYRIITGEFLMKRVLTDAGNGISLLAGLPFVDADRIGTLGHSYGGNTTLFLAALDERISFACASGSACTYEYRMKHGTGIEMASVIPNFHGKYDIDDLVKLVAPRKLLIVSSDEDKYSMDAPEIVEKAGKVYAKLGVVQNLEHRRYSGGHALTEERFRDIIEWIVRNA